MTLINNHLGYSKLVSFQQGGKIPPERKKELFPYFAYLYSKQMNPEKYGKVSSMEEWTKLIQSSKEDIDTITKAAAKLTDEDWASIEQQYQQAQQSSPEQEQQTEYAKKGTQLKKLKEKIQPVKSTKKGPDNVNNVQLPKKDSKPVQLDTMKKGGKTKTKKCSCGCDLVLSKGEGGKLTSKCACNCGGGKVKKKK